MTKEKCFDGKISREWHDMITQSLKLLQLDISKSAGINCTHIIVTKFTKNELKYLSHNVGLNELDFKTYLLHPLKWISKRWIGVPR